MDQYKCPSCGDKFRTYIDCLQHCNWHSPCDMMQSQPKLINWQNMEKLTLQELYEQKISSFKKEQKRIAEWKENQEKEELKRKKEQEERLTKEVWNDIYKKLESSHDSTDSVEIIRWLTGKYSNYEPKLKIYEKLLNENKIKFQYEDFQEHRMDIDGTDTYNYRRIIILKDSP